MISSSPSSSSVVGSNWDGGGGRSSASELAPGREWGVRVLCMEVGKNWANVENMVALLVSKRSMKSVKLTRSIYNGMCSPSQRSRSG